MNKARLLIVDDEEMIRGLLLRILAGRGHDCVAAADTSEARTCLARQPFDLVLSDIEMPGESGLELIRHVAAAYPDTGIVMVSVISDPEIVRVALEIGIFGYIVKPFDKSQVVICVANALRRRELEHRERQRRAELERQVQARTAELLTMNERLRQRDMELKRQHHRIAEVDKALSLLFDHRQKDKTDTEEKVLANVKRAVAPYIEKLRKSGLDEKQMRCLDILQAGIEDIISPFVRALSSEYLGLTPAELQVAHLIKQGLQTKEIADLIHLSPNTVMTHRYQIRRKLGLKNKRINLQTYLSTLDHQ